MVAVPFLFLSSLWACSKEDFTVAIDIGHSIKKPGAISARGIREYYFNKRIGEILLGLLVEKGFSNSFLVVSNGEDIPLESRSEIAYKRKANILLSIHHDSVQPQYLSSWTYQGQTLLYCDKYKGFSIFCSNKNKKPTKSLLFAKLLGAEMLKEGFIPALHHAEKIQGENRDLIDQEKGIYKFDELIILKNAKIPAVLFECGIIVNRDEEKASSDPVYYGKITHSILRAIIDYYQTDKVIDCFYLNGGGFLTLNSRHHTSKDF